MNEINSHISIDKYPNCIWVNENWLSVVFEDDWGNGCNPRHLNKDILNTLINVVSEIGEQTAFFSDPNLNDNRSGVKLNELDSLQIVSSSFYVVGSKGWGICGTGDGWCVVGGNVSIMRSFINLSGGFEKIRNSYQASVQTLAEHTYFLRQNFKNA